MTTMEWIYFGFAIIGGGCVGSFLNVVVYRMPLGQSLSSPPSHCPVCKTQLAWYDNVPVLGWFMLGGKCRYCKTPISIQYPLVEAFTAAVWGGWFYFCYGSGMRPLFFVFEPQMTMGVYLVEVILLSGLIAATLIDARFYIIPLEITWTIGLAAVLILPVAVAVWPDTLTEVYMQPLNAPGVAAMTAEERMAQALQYQPRYMDVGVVRAEADSGMDGIVELAAVPFVSVKMTAAAVGGGVGLLIALALLWVKVLPLSFPELPEEDAKNEGEALSGEREPSPKENDELAAEHGVSDDGEATNRGREPRSGEDDATGDVVQEENIQSESAEDIVDQPPAPVPAETEPDATKIEQAGSPVVPPVQADGETNSPPEKADPHPLASFNPEQHVAYPGARKEALKEVFFIAFPIIGALVGYVLATNDWLAFMGDFEKAARVVGGILAGYLIGGGTVWIVRIIGTFAFGKEAMGLGDVHLMAAVGAAIGWPLSVSAFFLAAFIGLGYAILALVVASIRGRSVRVLPYGPHLAVATVIVMIFQKTIIEHGHIAINGIFYIIEIQRSLS